MITVNDHEGVLDASQKRDLEATNASSHVVVNLVKVESPAVLDQLTQSCVTTPNTLCIGRDNGHKWTSVHPGIDLGIKGDAAIEVRKAGNADFRSGDVVGGLKAIVSRSEAVRMKQSTTAVVIDHNVVKHETVYWPLFVIGGGLVAIVVFFVLKARRSAKKAEETMRTVQTEAAEAASRNIEADRDDDLNRKFRALEHPERVDSVKVERPIKAKSNDAMALGSQAKAAHSTPVPVIVNTGPDFMDGVMMGEILSHRNEPSYPREYEPSRRREPTPSPEPVQILGGGGGGSTRDDDDDSSSRVSSVTSDDDNSSSSESNVGSDDE